MSKFVGSAKIKVNGQLVKTVPDSVTVIFGGPTRQSQMADDTYNYSETTTPASVEYEGLVTPKTKIKTLGQVEEGVVEIIPNNGAGPWTLTSATNINPIEVSTSTGRFKQRFEGDPIITKD
jgi:hypothetical protein